VQISRKETGLWLTLILLASASIFFRVISADPILARDDSHILAHLHGISSILDLLKAGQISSVIAFQPVRDLSYFLDIWIGKHFGFSSFHFTNFLIWGAIVLTVFFTLKLLYEDSRLAIALTALFALHPVFVGSIAWVAARKHLLSCFFALLATFSLLRFQKKGGSKLLHAVCIILAYSLSVLSQPITLLWPLWALVYCFCIPREKRRTGMLTLSMVCVPILIAGGIANFAYYNELYPVHTSAQKWVSTELSGVPLLALGRYFFNLFIPVRLALVYYPGSALNVSGLVLGFILLIFLRLRIHPRRFLPWFFYLLFPLAVVTIKPTNVFVSDTYLLTAAFGFINLAALAFGALKIKPKYVIYPLLACFALLSWKQVSAWESDRALWMSSYATEPTPRSLVFRIQYLIEDGNYDEAAQEALLLEAWDPGQADFPILFSKAVYRNPRMSVKEKLELLRKHRTGSPWFDYYQASLYSEQGLFSEALPLVMKIMAGEDLGKTFSEDLPIVAAEAVFTCGMALHKNCDDLARKAKTDPRSSKFWDEQRYHARLLDLRKS
jgi:hypothetical protein